MYLVKANESALCFHNKCRHHPRSESVIMCFCVKRSTPFLYQCEMFFPFSRLLRQAMMLDSHSDWFMLVAKKNRT